MTIDPTTMAQMAANNAEVDAAQQDMWQMWQEQMDLQRAEAEGSFYTQLGLREAGKGAENALWYMQEWQRTFNDREEARAQGIAPPPSEDFGIMFDNSQDNRWEIFGSIYGNNGDPDEENGSGSPSGA